MSSTTHGVSDLFPILGPMLGTGVTPMGNDSVQDDGGDVSHEQRAEAMCRMRAEGASLQEIADTYELTRERVRQIIREANGPSREVAQAARRAKAIRQRQELRDRALELCRGTPGLSVDDLAAALATTPAAVRAALGPEARRVLVTTHQGQPQFSDDDLLEHIRRAARIAGEPLTVRMYDEARVQFAGASAPLVLQRFGTWRVACGRAGVVTGRPVRTHYERRWTRDQLIEAVAEYLAHDGSRGSFADYEQWARMHPGRPSGQTVRTQWKLWSRAKSEALALLAGRSSGTSAGSDGASAAEARDLGHWAIGEATESLQGSAHPASGDGTDGPAGRAAATLPDPAQLDPGTA